MTIKFSNLFQSFSFSQFFTYKFTACSQSFLVYSLVRVGNFPCLFHSLVRVGRFFIVEITPVNNFDKRGILNYKGLEIKLLNIKLINYIGLDFLYITPFGWNLSFPCSFLRKSKKPPKTHWIYHLCSTIYCTVFRLWICMTCTGAYVA